MVEKRLRVIEKVHLTRERSTRSAPERGVVIPLGYPSIPAAASPKASLTSRCHHDSRDLLTPPVDLGPAGAWSRTNLRRMLP